MDKYVYLILVLVLGIPWFWIFYKRKDLRKKMLIISIPSGFFGIIAEYWYFRDYWQPPSLAGQAVVSIEDFLFGFFISGISASIYDFLTHSRDKDSKPIQIKTMIVMFFVGLLGLLIFNNYLDINSILVTSAIFLLLAVFMIFLRRDLMGPSILSGCFMLVLAVVVYFFLFDLIFPDYWDNYWLLADTKLGITLLGNIPLTELIWYLSWGCFAGIEYNFLFGQVKIK